MWIGIKRIRERNARHSRNTPTLERQRLYSKWNHFLTYCHFIYEIIFSGCVLQNSNHNIYTKRWSYRMSGCMNACACACGEKDKLQHIWPLHIARLWTMKVTNLLNSTTFYLYISLLAAPFYVRFFFFC